MSASDIKSPRKLIEVALPLDDINREAALRKRKAPAGYPTALHKWWAQRPPAAARAVLFAQLVNDPGYETGAGFQRGINKKEAARERERLFKIIRELVKWENTNNETVLEAARAEIKKSWRETCELNNKHPQAAELFDPEKLPPFYDPFAGSGAIPLEAQRLGLEAFASDLNPVAVLINKAMIEIPPKFAGRKPVGPLPQAAESTARNTREMHEDWSGAKGLAEDVRRYGHWMREEAKKRIGHLYPLIEITQAMAKDRPDLQALIGKKLTVIAWLWARTVRSPNPAYSNVEVPLASTFLLSTKQGKETWVEPIVAGNTYRFAVRTAAAGQGKPPASAKNGTKAPGRGSNFLCLVSDSPIGGDYIKAEGQAGRMGARLMAIVAEGAHGRVYLDPTDAMESIAKSARPTWKPDGDVPSRLTGGTCYNYGLTTWGELFTLRQLIALTAFSNLIAEARERIRVDARTAGMTDDGIGIDAGGTSATAYADAVGIYLTFAASRCSDYGCSIATWRPKDSAMRSGMSKQAIPMTWDYAEGNPFGSSSSGFVECAVVVAKVVAVSLAPKDAARAICIQRDAAKSFPAEWSLPVVSTDPPYYDNIGYADLSDFFYVCLRRTLRAQYPGLFATMAVPKAEELVATPYRHGGTEAAKAFFLAGMTNAMHRLAESAHPAFPTTIYYAHKQSEVKDKKTTLTGWETFLSAVLRSEFSISGTWPMKTEGDNRQVGVDTPPADIPDDWSLRLVVLPADQAWTRAGPNPARDAAASILRMRGSQPRQKQNRLLFLSADADQVMHLKDTARALLAWRSIEEDIRNSHLNLDALQTRQANQHREQTNETVLRLVRETFKCLIAPSQATKSDGTLSEIEWEMYSLNPATQGLGREIDRVLVENELVIREWAPIHLHNLLKRWFWKEGVNEVSALDVWQKSCQYAYFPRLANSHVLQSAIAAGASSRDFFGVAYDRDDAGAFKGFCFGERTSPIFDATLLLIEPSAAAAYEKQIQPIQTGDAAAGVDTAVPSSAGEQAGTGAAANTPTSTARPTRYYGTIELDPIKASLQFSKLASELVELFTANPAAKVSISVDIRAEDQRGFDPTTVRAARENGKSLGFKTSEFE